MRQALKVLMAVAVVVTLIFIGVRNDKENGNIAAENSTGTMARENFKALTAAQVKENFQAAMTEVKQNGKGCKINVTSFIVR